MLTIDFLTEFRNATETRWRDCLVNPQIYGFQFQAGTCWNPGLSDKEISEYEDALDIHFSEDFRTFLRAMNGTSAPTLNLFGSSGEPPRHSVGVYSYPRDLELVRGEVRRVREEMDSTILAETLLEEEGFLLPPNADLVPIYAHRYVVCIPGQENSAVLSIWTEDDAIVYGQSLDEYLIAEFLREPVSVAELKSLRSSLEND